MTAAMETARPGGVGGGSDLPDSGASPKIAALVDHGIPQQRASAREQWRGRPSLEGAGPRGRR